MSERYSRLFALSGETYTPGAPVTLAAGALLKDNQTGKVLAQLKLRSISPKPIKAAKVQIIPMDTVGRPLGEPVKHAYLDLSVSRNVDFGQKSAILLPDAECRRFSARVTEVAFGDNTVWSSNGEWKPLPYARPLQEALPDVELYKQYRLTYGNQCRYLPLEHEDLWYCGCGALNRKEEGACHHCGLELFRLKTVDWAALDVQKNARVAAEQAEAKRLAEEQAKADAARRAAEARQQEIAAAKAKKKKKTAAICAVLAVVVCAAAYVVTQIILPAQAQKEAYAKAQALFDAGRYQEAISAFGALEDYKDSVARISECNTAILDGKYNDAIALMDAGEYAEAISAFEALEDYKDSVARISECNTAILDGKYNDAIALMDAGEYTEAISAFEALEDYKDSVAKISECNTGILDSKYNDAIALMDAGKYAAAKTAFKALGDYKDSAAKADQCYAADLDNRYNNAIALIDAGNIVDAYNALIMLQDYKDSADKANSIYDEYKVEKLKLAKVGDYITFGAYEQDTITTNGKEAIEWLVLDVQDGKLLVTSKYALDCKPYHTSRTNVTWQTCTLRKWLNNDFIKAAFSAEERAMISSVTVPADGNPEYNTNPGNATQDKVFLLSLAEAKRYFRNQYARECSATLYAVESGANRGGCDWWLRSPGAHQNMASDVWGNGEIQETGWEVNNDSCAVRPTLWIDLDA